MSKQAYVPVLLKLFREFGYEGVTLSKISQATGLGKASLYHYFPGGKVEMAKAALTQVNNWLENSLLPILEKQAKPIDIFQAMGEEVNRFFNEGQNSCLWAVLLLEQSSDNLFHSHISWAFETWIEAITAVLIAAGLDTTLARQRGEDTLIALQGALIVSHGLRNFSPFQRVLKELPQQLCSGL
jgi:TetR/AcrR family transcriptional regulator, lmrAB and yxaGH operons repressor